MVFFLISMRNTQITLNTKSIDKVLFAGDFKTLC